VAWATLQGSESPGRCPGIRCLIHQALAVVDEKITRIGGRFAHFVQRHVLWLLLGCYALAGIWPEPGLPLRRWTWSPGGMLDFRITVPLLLLALMLFSAALLADMRQIRAVLREPLLLCIAILAVWFGPALLVILAAYVVPLLIPADAVTGVIVGLMLVATMPVANSSTAWTQNTGGNLALSLALVVISISLCPLVTPQLLNALGTSLSASEQVYGDALASRFSSASFIAWVIIPTLAGIAGRRLFGPQRVELARHWFILGSAGALLLLNYINAAIALPPLSDSPPAVVAVSAMLAAGLSAVGLLAGWLVAHLLRLPAEMRTALLFSLSMKHAGLALVLAASVLAEQPLAILMIIFAALTQHLCAGFVQWFLQHRAKKRPRRKQD
jgi:bile acid:Na+ symporter, BASS family